MKLFTFMKEICLLVFVIFKLFIFPFELKIQKKKQIVTFIYNCFISLTTKILQEKSNYINIL